MIDPDIRRAYESDGVVCLRRAFDAEWLQVASDAIEQGRASPGPMYVDYSADVAFVRGRIAYRGFRTGSAG